MLSLPWVGATVRRREDREDHMLAPATIGVRYQLLRRSPTYISVQVPHQVGFQKRTYLVTVGAGTATSEEETLQKVQQTALRCRGIQENFVIIPDFADPNVEKRLWLHKAWRSMKIPNQHMVPIIAADSYGPESLMLFAKFLKMAIDEGGPFKNILVVKGSTKRALEIKPSQSQYAMACDIVHKAQRDALGVVLNQHTPHEEFIAEMKRKALYGAVRYFMQPTFYMDGYLDPKTVEMLKRMMLENQVQMTFGLFRATMNVYKNQSMPVLSTDRVTAHGMDRYVGLRKLVQQPGGAEQVDLGYEPLLLKWLQEHHPDPSSAIQTRDGLGLDGAPLLQALNATAFDLKMKYVVKPPGWDAADIVEWRK
jgi:hypothetical protein